MSRGAVETDHAIAHEALRFLALGDEASTVSLIHRIESAPGRRLLERAAVHQGMVTALASLLETHGFELSSSFRSRAEAAQITRLSSESILARIDTSLTERGIPWVAMKGSVVAHRYERPELRSFNDIDILVPGRRLGETLTALSEAGFEDINRNWGNYLRFEIAETPLLASGASIDLHWHLIAHGARRKGTSINVVEMIERRRTVRLSHIEVPTFDSADLLLHVAIHAALSGGTRLSWLRDIREVARSEHIHWGVFLRRAIDAGIPAQVGQVLDRARIIVDAGVPEGLLEELSPRSLLVIRRRIDERDTGLGLPKRFLRGFPVASSRPTLTHSLAAAAARVGRRMRPEPGWDVADPNGPLYWQRESGDSRSRREYLAWAAKTGGG